MLCLSLKFIYSEKATIFCEISTVDLSYVVMVKSTLEISQNFVAVSEYMNFKTQVVQIKTATSEIIICKEHSSTLNKENYSHQKCMCYIPSLAPGILKHKNFFEKL